MTTKFVGKKTTVRDSFKAYAEKKLAKLNKFFESEADATIVVSNEAQDETVEVTIKASGLFFRAEKTSDDRTVAFDMVMDVLTRQIVKNKKKLEKKFKAAIPEDFFTAQPEEEKEEPEKTLVRKKKFFVGTMTADEAVLQMELIGHEFFMFRNPADGQINVVYRRRDGNYGLLEPID